MTTTTSPWTITEVTDGDLKASMPYSREQYVIAASLIDALREYFQHKRDEALGRWRDPVSPNRVVYPRGENRVYVVNFDSARRYFAAHPEPKPKPWEEAKDREVWALTIRGGTPEPGICVDGEFQLAAGYIHVTSEAITAGRRIWPEEEATK